MSLRPVCYCSCYQCRKRFIVGGTNGRERDRSQVSDGMVERTLRARSPLGCMRDVLCVELIPLCGVSCPPFYRPRGSRGFTDGRKRKKPKVEVALRRCRAFPFPWACTSVMPDHARDGTSADPDRAMPWPCFSEGLHPILPDRQCGVSGCQAMTLRAVDELMTIHLLL